MPERRSVRLKIPSERLLLLQQSMDGLEKKKRKQRVNWKPGEKEAMVALREQCSTMPLKEFQQTYYPDRSVKNLWMIIKSLKDKQPGKEEEAETGSEDRLRPTTPRLDKLKRPRKNGPFEYSDSEDEDSSSDEIIEDINPSGHRTPNKFIKLSHSAESQSPPNRYEKHRDPRVRSQTGTIAQKETTACLPRPQTPPPLITTVVQDTGCSELNSSPMCMSPLSSKGPEISSLDERPQIPKETAARLPSPQRTPPQTTIVAQDSSYSEPSSSSTGMSPIVLVFSQEQPGKFHGTEMQVDIMQDESQKQMQLTAPKQEEFPEHYIRQEAAKDSADMFAKLQRESRRQDNLISLISQLRVENSALQKKCDMMQQDYELTKKEIDKLKVEREVEIAQLKEKWQAEKELLVQKNAHLDKGLEKMREAMKYLQASPSTADGG